MNITKEELMSMSFTISSISTTSKEIFGRRDAIFGGVIECQCDNVSIRSSFNSHLQDNYFITKLFKKSFETNFVLTNGINELRLEQSRSIIDDVLIGNHIYSEIERNLTKYL